MKKNGCKQKKLQISNLINQIKNGGTIMNKDKGDMFEKYRESLTGISSVASGVDKLQPKENVIDKGSSNCTKTQLWEIKSSKNKNI